MTRRDSCHGRLLRADLSHLSLEQCMVGAERLGPKTFLQTECPGAEAWRHILGGIRSPRVASAQHVGGKRGRK